MDRLESRGEWKSSHARLICQCLSRRIRERTCRQAGFVVNRSRLSPAYVSNTFACNILYVWYITSPLSRRRPRILPDRSNEKRSPMILRVASFNCMRPSYQKLAPRSYASPRNTFQSLIDVMLSQAVPLWHTIMIIGVGGVSADSRLPIPSSII